MTDDEITQTNACTDLVTLRKSEAFPLRLLGQRRGEWVCVRSFCLQIGMPPPDLSEQVFATWLADPAGDDAFAVILFYDDESKWTMAAHYNRARLLAGTSPQPPLQPSDTAPLQAGQPAARQ